MSASSEVLTFPFKKLGHGPIMYSGSDLAGQQKLNFYFLSVPRVLPGKLAACICAPNIQVDFTARSIPRCWVGGGTGEVLGKCWGGVGEVLGRC